MKVRLLLVFLSLVVSLPAIKMQFKNTAETQPTNRNPLLWPFATDSIWNTPIGSDAKYVDANIQQARALATDIDHFFVLNDTDPQRDVYNIGSWHNRTSGTRDLGFDLPIPDELIIPEANEVERPNNSSALLLPDGETLIQLNATTRDRVGGRVNGVKYPFYGAPNETLTSSGALGGHGGSGLSSIGGTIRLGELTGDEPIRHALKINLWGEKYLSYTEGLQGGLGYRWPAVKADREAERLYGGQVEALKMGSLLAIPPGVTPESLGIETEPALKIFYALQDYGGYVVDDTAWDAHSIITENGVLQEFEHEYGHRLNDRSSEFFDEVMTLFTALHVVNNNSPDNIGGGGTPRAPLAPPIEPSYVTELQQLMDDPTVEDAFRADFNGDGNQDLLWRNLATGLNHIWLQDSQGNQVGGGNILPLTDPNWQIQETPDVDQDGKAEIVWENRSTGAQQTWHLDDLRIWVDPDSGKRVARWRSSGSGSPRITFSEPPVETIPEPTPEPEPTSQVAPPPQEDSIIGEYDNLTVNHNWQTIDFNNTYRNPVVIVSDPTVRGGDPAAVRIQNITDSSFQLRLQEPRYLDDLHATESASYIVLEAGDWTLADGTRISAGLHNSDLLTSKGFDKIDLQKFDSTPAILSQTQTFNGGDWITTRTQEQSNSGFQLAMQEEEALNSGNHIQEKIGWLAVEQGAASDGDTLLQSSMTGREVNSDLTAIQFEESFSTAPSLIAKLGSYYGADTANLRIHEISDTSFGVQVYEDKSLDAEIGHTKEAITFLALEGTSGTLTGSSV